MFATAPLHRARCAPSRKQSGSINYRPPLGSDHAAARVSGCARSTRRGYGQRETPSHAQVCVELWSCMDRRVLPRIRSHAEATRAELAKRY